LAVVTPPSPVGCAEHLNSPAGIVYGRSGVCHQAANRILHPAGLTVAGSGGYATSVFVFGAYGRGAWPQHGQCYSSAGPVGASDGPDGGSVSAKRKSRSEKLRAYDARTATLQESAPAPSGRRGAELDALLDLQLDERLSASKRNRLAAIQDELDRFHAALDRDLDAGWITQERYLEGLSGQVTVALGRCREVLGGEAFDRLFGEAGRRPEGLLQRRALAE
jgi:hypothetical protein